MFDPRTGSLVHVSSSLSSRLTRRRLIAAASAFAITRGSFGRPDSASANVFEVYANVSWDAPAELFRKESLASKVTATLDPGTRLLLLEGPTNDGLYKVNPIDLPDVEPGWLPATSIVFAQGARALVDLTLLPAPDDWSYQMAAVPLGFTVTLIGAVKGDWVLVRSGTRAGWVSIWSIEASDQPETDSAGERWVDVNRSTQEVRLHVGDSAIHRFMASVSADPGEGFYSTAIGTYWIYDKVAGLSFTPYANAYFMYWAGFDPNRFNGFHSWTMDAAGNVIDGGWGTTAGCVATAPADAAVVYDFVVVGTRVEIHW